MEVTWQRHGASSLSHSGHRTCLAKALFAEPLAGLALNFKTAISNMQCVKVLYMLISESILNYLY